MDKMKKISELYGEVDNLSRFTHPTLGKTFYMSDEKLIELAKKIVNEIKSSDYRNIVVCETGSRPLAMVCEKLISQSKINVKWTYMKFPREIKGNIANLILFYLSSGEREQILEEYGKSREEVIIDLCKLIPISEFDLEKKQLSQLLNEISKENLNEKKEDFRSQIVSALRGSKIAKTLGESFIFFDEYIDSGTTLQRALFHFKFFSDKINFKALSYYIYLDDYTEFDCVLFSLFDNRSKKEYFEIGTYRFENRVDLIGYFYNIDDYSYEKINLEDIRKNVLNENLVDPTNFLIEVGRVIENNQLLKKFKHCFKVDCVKNYVGYNHLVRQFLVSLEQEIYGESMNYDFLWKLADMYGPMWSPMPKENHLDFFGGVEKCEQIIKNLKEWKDLKRGYKEVRPTIIVEAVDVCLERQKGLIENLNRLLLEEI